MLLLLSKYWPVPVVLFLLAGAFLAHKSAVRGADKAGYARATQEMAAKVVIENDKTAEREKRDRHQSEAASAAWSVERERLQGQVVDLLARGVDVRLCKRAPANSGQVQGDPKATSPTPVGTGREVDAVQAGRNVGPELVRIAGECEGYRKQLKALIEWQNSLE